MNQSRAHASRSLLWSSIDIFSQTGFSILALVLLARWLRIEDIGLGSLAITLVQLLTMPLELAFHDALIQRRNLLPSHGSSAFTITLIGSLVATILLLMAAPWIASAYNKPELIALLRTAAVAIPFSGITAIVGALLRRNLEFAPLARRTLLGRTAGVMLGLVAAWQGAGAWTLVVMYVASIVLSTLVLLMRRQHVPALGVSRTALRDLLGFAAPNMLAQTFLLANGRVFLALAGLQLGAVALGAFALAFRLVEELRNTLSTAAVQLALPLMAKRAHDLRQLIKVFTEATSFTACVLLPLFAGLAITATDLLPLAFGTKWTTAVPATQWLAIAAVIMTLRQYSSITLNALGLPGVNAWINGFTFLSSIALLLANPVAQLASVAMIWPLRSVVLVLLSLWCVRRSAHLTYAVQLKPVVAPLLATTIMTASLLAMNNTLLMSASSGLRLASDIGAGALVYVISLLCISPTLLERLMHFVRGALSPAESSAKPPVDGEIRA